MVSRAEELAKAIDELIEELQRLDDFKTDLEFTQESLNEINRHGVETDVDSQALQSDVQNLSEDIQELQQSLVDIIDQGLRSDIQELQAEIEQMNDVFSGTTGGFLTSGREGMGEKLDRLNQSIQDLRDDVQRMR